VGALKAGVVINSDLTLVRHLGAGGMATVWLAEHRRLGCEVVVKFLSESLVTDVDAQIRFTREVTATVQVRSPHVVQILDHGISPMGLPFIVMELLEGCDLSKTMKEGPLSPDEILHVMEGVAAALGKAHERGIVHRDIKPANVFMCNGGPRPFVKLVDFGIAKRLEDVTMTATNAFLGTPAYMSPEQLRGARHVDHRSDLWALGVLAFHMFTGRPPFHGPNIANVIHTILSEDFPRLTQLRPDLPPALDAFMRRALAKDPDERFQSAAVLIAAFAEAVPTSARRRALEPISVLSSVEVSVPMPTPGTRRMDAPRVADHTLPLAQAVPVPPAPMPRVPVTPMAAGTSPVLAPRGSRPSHPHAHVPSPAATTFDGINSTVRPAVLSRPPAGGRKAMLALVTVSLGMALVAVALRVGYALRERPASMFPPAAAAEPPPAPEPAAPPAPATGTVIGFSSPMPVVPVATAPPQPSTTTPPRQKRPSRPKSAGRNDDDVGF
jgi:serine/threonine-protein kinase